MASSRLIQLFQIDQYFPVTSGLCDYLSIIDIINLTRTCRSLSGLYQALLPHKWDVDRALGRFFCYPHRFRSQLGRCNALVSGSFATQFFERVTWTDADIDIYVENELQTHALRAYLEETEGYTLCFEDKGEFFKHGDRSMVTSVCPFMYGQTSVSGAVIVEG